MADHLLFTSDPAAARVEIERLGGRISQLFTNRVFVGALPDDVDPSDLAAASGTRPDDLDATSVIMSDAWRAREAKPPSTEAIPWDAPGFKPPR